MTLADLSDEALRAEWQGRNTVLSIVQSNPARDTVPAVVIESLIDWAKEPMTESMDRIDRLSAADRRLTSYLPSADPMTEGLPDRAIAAVQAERSA